MLNQIRRIKIISTSNFQSKTSFDLKQNNMDSLEIEMENLQPTDLYTLKLGDNPFHCDLSLHNLFEKNENTKQLLLIFENANCSKPSSVKGRFLRDLKRKDLMCNSVNFFSNCTCYYESSNQRLEVNCSGLGVKISPDMIKDAIVTVDRIEVNEVHLNLANNLLTSLPEIAQSKDYNVTKMNASNNSILTVTVNNFGDSVSVLDLSNNSLDYLNKDVLTKISKMRNVSLGLNPWICDCSSLDFFSSIKSISNIISDYDNMFCENLGKKFDDVIDLEVCFNWALVAGFAGFLAVSGLLSSLFFKFKKDIKIFLYAHDMCLWFVNEEEIDEDKIYDAFVCFASEDQGIVENIIIELESEPEGFRCLVGIRDWEPGHMFPELVSYCYENYNFN